MIGWDRLAHGDRERHALAVAAGRPRRRVRRRAHRRGSTRYGPARLGRVRANRRRRSSRCTPPSRETRCRRRARRPRPPPPLDVALERQTSATRASARPARRSCSTTAGVPRQSRARTPRSRRRPAAPWRLLTVEADRTSPRIALEHGRDARPIVIRAAALAVEDQHGQRARRPGQPNAASTDAARYRHDRTDRLIAATIARVDAGSGRPC